MRTTALRSLLVWLGIFFIGCPESHAQSILVSEYLNFAGPQGEWNELIVVQDNLDMRGFIVSDNNGNQDARQGGVRCKNIDYWKNVRAGTILGIWHRNYPSGSLTDSDADMSDGRIMLAQYDTAYFEVFEFGLPGRGFDLNRTGDFIEVFNRDTVHIHAIGHKEDGVPGSYWNTMPTPKANVMLLCENGWTNRVYPGATLADYNGANLEVRSQTCVSNITRTLPNKDCNTGASNYLFWHSLRQPSWTAPTLQNTITATQVILNWNAMTDPNPTDGTQGYLVVRDSGTTPFAPVDGRIYNVGERIANTVVLANLPSQTLNFSDNIDLPCGVIYTYRVFAYRFAQDGEYGVNTTATSARGRQYNRDNAAFREAFKQVATGPKLQYAASQTAFCDGGSLSLSVAAQPGFTAQWLLNGTDITGETGLTYTARTSGQYRLKLRNAQGCLVLTDSVDVTVNPLPAADIFPKNVQLCKDSTALLQGTANADYLYQWYLNGNVINGATDAQYLASIGGSYSLKVTHRLTLCSSVASAVTVKYILVNFSTKVVELTFPDLADCESYADNSTAITITNNSISDSLHLRVVEPPHFSIVSPTFPLHLGIGESVNVVVRFSPTASGVTNETMNFVTSPCSTTQFVNMRGSKANIGVGVSSNVSSKDFGIIPWCTTTTAVDSVVLSVTQNTDVSSISIAQPFSISAADAGGFSLTAGQRKTILVNFNSNGNPSRVGKEDLVVRFKAGACNDSIKVNLRGSYALPQLLTNISTLNFPPLDSCNLLSKDTVIQISNTSTIDLELKQLSDAALQIVEIVGTGTLKIPAGETRQVTLRFSPNGYASIVNKQISFSALPCVDLSGFIYNGVRRGLQSSVTTPTVDFGDVTSCNGLQASSQTIRLRIQSINGATATLQDVRFSSSAFSTNAQSGQSLSEGDNVFTISIVPSAKLKLGAFSEKVFLTLAPCDIQQEVVLSGNVVGENVSLRNSTSKDTTLQFGTLDIGTNLIRTTTLKNNSTFAVVVGTIASVIGDYTISSVPPSGSTLQPGDELTVTTSFTPSTSGIFNQRFVVPIVSPCLDSIIIDLRGEGRKIGLPLTPFKFVIGNINAKVGEAITIPVEIVGSSLAGRDLRRVDALFGYNTSMLKVSGIRIGDALQGFGASIAANKDGVLMTAQGGTKISGPGIAFYLDATVLLGDALRTPLFIDTSIVLITSDELRSDTPQNGSLTLSGTCNLANRLVKIGGAVSLMLMNSQSRSGLLELAFETVGEQYTSIDVYNIVGEHVRNLYAATTKAGVHTIDVQTTSLPQGMYFLTMQSGIANHSLMFQLVK